MEPWACKCSIHVLMCPFLARSEQPLLWSLWERNSLHEHWVPRVVVISKVVLLVVLVAIHHEVCVWCFTLKHISEWLSMFTSLSDPPTPKGMTDPQVIWGNCLELDGQGSNIPSCEFPIHPMGQFFHFQCMQSILPIIQGNPISSSLANRRLKSSVVEWHMYSTPETSNNTCIETFEIL